MTKGEQTVRVSFNPSKDSVVDQIKAKYAELIDLIDEHKFKEPRLAALATTTLEESCMWAVKCVTTDQPPVKKEGL